MKPASKRPVMKVAKNDRFRHGRLVLLRPGWQRRSGEALFRLWPLTTWEDGPFAKLHPSRRRSFYEWAARIVRAAVRRR